MPKYKVGDVAALFPKPSAPKSDTGMKIQSLFDDFYKNSNKVNKPNQGKFQQKKKQTNNAEKYTDTPKEGKKKKRKFGDIDDNESNAQDATKPQKKQKKAKFDSTHQNSNGKSSQEDNYFPRNKKKSKQFKENSSAFSEMHFDDDEDESFSHFQSEVQKTGDKKKKKNKLSMSEIFENHDSEKFKNKSSKKIKVFINSRNQSDEFDVNETSENNKLSEEKQSPEKKSKKKKNKKQKKDKIVQNKAVAQEMPSDSENIEIQNDDEKPKIKKKSKKVKKSFPLENSLSQKSESDDDLEDKDKSSKASLDKKKKKPEETAERLSRTLFVGNLPVKMTRHGLQKLFSPFGSIETCRLRGSVPVKATIPKKVAAIKSQFHAGQKSCIGYVVFKDAIHATEALTLNGDLVGDHHIVVNPASSTGEKKTYDENRSVFIGNLPFDVEDEAIWAAFAACGEVEAVRAIRDPETGAGKGFGYVLFKNTESKEAALKMEGIEIANRKIRIKEVKSNIRKPVPASNNKLSAMKRKAWKLKSKKDGPNSRKSLKKLMNREKLNYQKKKIANIFKKFSA